MPYAGAVAERKVTKIMNGLKTRKQAKDARQERRNSVETRGLDARREEALETSENIFLFYPNIIGLYILDPQEDAILILSRLLPYSPCDSIALLHAPSS